VALPVGILMGWYRVAFHLGDPLLNFLNALPRIALAPLTIVWFGVGLQSKFAVVFASAVFPILMSTVAGVRSIDRDYIRAARLYGAGDMKIFRVVALPGSVPYILSGMRIGIGHALIGVVVAELIAAQHGVGLVIATAGQTFQTPLTFAAIIIVGVVGLVLTTILSLIEHRFDRWRVR
jgi:NitT/TauT family transport system permease protein